MQDAISDKAIASDVTTQDHLLSYVLLQPQLQHLVLTACLQDNLGKPVPYQTDKPSGILLRQGMMDVLVVTTGTLDVRSSSQINTTNIPTLFFYGPDALPVFFFLLYRTPLERCYVHNASPVVTNSCLPPGQCSVGQGLPPLHEARCGWVFLMVASIWRQPRDH